MSFPTPLDVFLLRLSPLQPALTVSIDRHPGEEDRAAWVEITDTHRQRSIDVEYRPGQGFGLHVSEDSQPFGGPDEVVTTPEEAVARLRTLFA